MEDKSKPSQHLTHRMWSSKWMCGQFNNPLKQYHNNTNTGKIPRWFPCGILCLPALTQSVEPGITLWHHPCQTYPQLCRLQQNICSKGMLSFNVGTKQSHNCVHKSTTYIDQSSNQPQTQVDICAYYNVSVTPNIIMTHISQFSTCIRSHILTPESISSRFPKKKPKNKTCIRDRFMSCGEPGLCNTQGHFAYETECPWPLHFKHSHWWKRRSRSKFASHYAWGTNGVCECKMDVKSTWIPTWHPMDHVSWSLGLFSKITSWK